MHMAPKNLHVDEVNFDEPHWLHVPLKCYSVALLMHFMTSIRFIYNKKAINKQRIMIFELTVPTNPKQTNE